MKPQEQYPDVAKRVSGEIDFSGYYVVGDHNLEREASEIVKGAMERILGLVSGGNLGKRVCRELTEIVCEEFKQSVLVFLPYQSTKPEIEVDDPLTLHIEIPLGRSDEQPLIFEIKLESILKRFTDCWSYLGSPIDEPEGVMRTRTVAARLRQLADHLDAQVAA